MKRLGERIKKNRELRNLQLNELAGMVGITSSALSQIENAKIFPSVPTLKAIAENLHTTVGDLIGENDSLKNSPVVRKSEKKFTRKSPSGTEMYFLTHHDTNKMMDTFLFRFNVGSCLDDMFAGHTGQIFGYMESGKIEMVLDNTRYILKRGDTVYFSLNSSFSMKNINNNVSEIVWVLSPPGF